MGIPRLTTQVHPYAQQISWDVKQPSVNTPIYDQHVVIDGPSFAYYVYHLCTIGKSGRDLTLNAFPSYSDLATAAITWLDDLESFGLFVKHIYFDGFLPSPKTNTRYERLSKSLAQLYSIRSTNSRSAPGKPSDMPSAPFLVSAVCDALWSSKYSDRTSTIPCEAEVFCTDNMVLDGDEIVLTNDSDLLLLAESNRIMFFSSLEIHSYTQCVKTLHGEIYDTTHIKTELGCTDLFRIAFMLMKHPNSTLKELANRLNSEDLSQRQDDASYVRFRQQFLPEYQYSTFAWASKGAGKLADVSRQLDARVSEFVNDWGAYVGTKNYPLLGHNSNDAAREAESRHMFLPFLIDDPWRASAWRASNSVRVLAYSLLALYGPRFRMMEVDRRGEKILGVHVSLISQPAGVGEACKSLLGDLSYLDHGNLATLDRWKLVSVLQILSLIQEQGSELPPRSDVRNLCLSPDKLPGWNFVHLSAQVQAYLYSLRILTQILEIYLAADIRTGIDRKLLIGLRDRLCTIPLIPEIMPRPGESLALGTSCAVVLDQAIDTFYPKIIKQTKEGYQEAKSKTKRKAKKEQKVAEKVVGSKTTARQLTNMFSVLEDI